MNLKSNMFFIFKLVLIILLNETYAYVKRDIDTILLPAWNPTGAKEIPLSLKVFGQMIQLNLRRNEGNVSSPSESWKYNAKNLTKKLLELNVSDPCYYHHEDHISSATINFCDEHGLEGLLFLKNNTFEIRPLRNGVTYLNDICMRQQTNLSFGKPHLIKRSLQDFAYSQSNPQRYNIELAVFFDEAAYRMYIPFFRSMKYKDTILHNIILAYVNQIQAILHDKSFGASIDISLVRLDIMKNQPSNLPVVGDSDELLHSFCTYANSLNPSNDDDPRHWDISLYLTGIDLYSVENGRRDYDTEGLSFSDAACNVSASCSIVEFGITTKNTFSAFSTVRTAAHEIGHLLEMGYDSDMNCTSNEYIMANIHYNRGQVTWSECSRKITKNLWKTQPCLLDRTGQGNFTDLSLSHSRYQDLPGSVWTATIQCKLFLRDKDASVITLHDICQALKCESLIGDYSSGGPALDGTLCENYLGTHCRGGQCVSVLQSFLHTEIWSEFEEDSCESSCVKSVKNSKGVQVKRRFCRYGSHKKADCRKLFYDEVVLCNDSSLCTEKRETIETYTTKKCTEFVSKLENSGHMDLNNKWIKEGGSQHVHDNEKPLKACTVYCTRKLVFKEYTYEAPFVQMLDVGMDPYLPDGTWCHNENGQDYYCRQHYCLPEDLTI